MILIIIFLLATGLHASDLDEAIKIVTHSESYSSTPYFDSDSVLAIGYGTRSKVKHGQFMSKKTAMSKMVADLKYRQTQIMDMVNVKLNSYQLQALISFAYNIGLGAFRKSTLLRELNKGNYELETEFMRWVYVRCRDKACEIEGCKEKQGGLVTRREMEWKLFRREP